MPWRESMEPVRMQRIAVMAPRERLRDVLVQVAASGQVELESSSEAVEGDAARLLQHLPHADGIQPLLSPTDPDLDAWVRDQRADLLTGEAELDQRASAAVTRGLVSGVVGWMPAVEVEDLASSLATSGASVVPLPTPRGIDPPTRVHDRGKLNQSFAPLVDTYSTVPYADVDPTVLAGIAFVVMFGMMFADAGQGTLLLIGGLLLRAGHLGRLNRFRAIWPFVVGAGAMSIVMGVLFGEFFGPTGVLPVLWIEPLEEPILLLAVSIGVGACLLAGAYVLGTVNRWREGGWQLALVAPSGLAGIAVFLGIGLLGLGLYAGLSWLVWTAVVVAVGGLALTYVGLLAASGGGATGATEAGVELFDGVIRLGTNIVSFARLAAFGLAHAALSAIIWDATTGLWSVGGLAYVAAIAVFLLGNTFTFVLEAVVAGVQALRLEYYELFSRVFVSEGRPFRPWFVPTAASDAASRGSALEGST
jgi:V/A-type H+-transporting ATPase subunit I